MRTGIVVVLLCLATAAHAERGPYGAFSIDAGYSWDDQHTDATSYGFPVESFTEHGHGPGYGGRLTGGFDAGNGLRWGAFVRIDAMHTDFENHYADGATHPLTFRTTTLGPTISVASRRGLYARADLGLGFFHESGRNGFDYGRSNPLELLAFAAEGGYERLVAPGWRVQVGVGVQLMRLAFGEEGTETEYAYTWHFVTPSIVVSIQRGH